MNADQRTVFAGAVTPPLPGDPAPPKQFGEAGALVGRVLNDMFEVTRYITQGGMGEVYEGRNTAGGARVAIKVILPQYAADAQFFALFQREAGALERLGHDAIVKYRTLAFDRAAGVHYLVLEYIPGPSLADVLDGTPAASGVAMRLLKRLAAGLDAAHSLGVVHRDLSPDNILLRDGHIERATIIDFGIAKDTEIGAKSVVGEAFAGKFGYAAPEVFGKYGREVGAWSDVYSLALVIAAVARGRPLDMGVTIVDALDARGSVPALDGFDDALAGVLGLMLVPDPAHRLRSMGEVLAAIEQPAPFAPAAREPGAAAATVDRLDTPPPSGPSFVRVDAVAPQPQSKPKSRLPLFASGGVALAALIAVGVYFLGGGTKPAAPAATEVSGGTPPPAPVPPAGAPVLAVPAPTTAAAPLVRDLKAAMAAVAALPCSDVRAAAPAGDEATLKLSGWMPRGTAVPASAGGYRLAASTVAAVLPPSAGTCALVRQIAEVTGERGSASGLTLAPATDLTLSALPSTIGGYPLVPTGLSGATRAFVLVNIDDAPPAESQRLFIMAGSTLADGIPYDPKPTRYLRVYVSGDHVPIEAGKNTIAGLARGCRDGCKSVSGWLTLR